MNIPIFKAEKEAGLEDLIKASAAVALCGDADLVASFEIPSTAKAYLLTKAENKNQIDLAYLKTILVSTGWNLNDDVFDPLEMWSAKSSPEDKPFNYEHCQDDIIGHITGCYAINTDGDVLLNDTDSKSIPSHYHIVASSVLYKIWENPEKQQRMDNILSEISQGKWFVSMEALFRGFDYAIKSSKGTEIIARNEKTAFLTKYLKAYGGNGKFEDAKIGRVLRNIVFSGKGLVRKPANPESVILSATKASGYDQNEPIKENEMSELVLAQEKAAQLQTELENAQAELAKIKAEKQLTDRISTIASKLEANPEEATTLATALNTLADAEFNTVVATAEAYMSNKLSAYKAKASDLSEIKAALEDLMKGQKEMNDKFHEKMEPVEDPEGPATPEKEAEAVKMPAKPSAKTPVKKISGPFKMGSMPKEAAPIVTGSDDDQASEDATASEVLDSAKPNEEPALASAPVEADEMGKIAAQIAAYLNLDSKKEEAKV
jgi:hypothetical protein